MTEPLKPFPDRVPGETGGIIGAMDALGQLTAFIQGQRGYPTPHRIVASVFIDPADVPDAEDRERRVRLFAESHGAEVEMGTYVLFCNVPVPNGLSRGPELIYHVYTLTLAGHRDAL